MKTTTELHNAAEKLDVTLCNTLIDAHPKSVLALNDKGDTPLHVLLKKIFSVHPNKYQQQEIHSHAMLVRKMMNASEEMLQHIPSLITRCYFEEIHFSGSYPSKREVIAVTHPQILGAFNSSINLKNLVSVSDGAELSDENDAKRLEDFARYQMGDKGLADEIMVDRLLIEMYQKSFIK